MTLLEPGKIHLFAVIKAGKFKLVIAKGDTQKVAASSQLKSKYLISDICVLRVPQIKSVVSQSYLKGMFLFIMLLKMWYTVACWQVTIFQDQHWTLCMYICISFNCLFLLIILITAILWWEEIVPSFFRNITHRVLYKNMIMYVCFLF